MLGTDKPSQELWLKHIKDWRSSNLSQADYCQNQYRQRWRSFKNFSKKSF